MVFDKYNYKYVLTDFLPDFSLGTVLIVIVTLPELRSQVLANQVAPHCIYTLAGTPRYRVCRVY